MILAVNTSAPQFSLSLLSLEGAVAAEHLMSQRKGHFGDLMPSLQFLLRSIEGDIRQVRSIGVAVGPGSFTGLRIGLSLVKGLSHALNVPVVGVSSLEALAVQVPCQDRPVVAMIQSRKGEVFASAFVWETEGRLVRILEDTWVRLEEVTGLLQGPAVLVGNDYGGQGILMEGLVPDRITLAPPHCWAPRASAVGTLALRRLREGEADDPHALHPIYLRPPDIRPNPYAGI